MDPGDEVSQSPEISLVMKGGFGEVRDLGEKLIAVIPKADNKRNPADHFCSS